MVKRHQSGDMELGTPPPLLKKSWQNKGGFPDPNISGPRFWTPKWTLFEALPLSNAPNTQNFPPAAGQTNEKAPKSLIFKLIWKIPGKLKTNTKTLLRILENSFGI